MVTNSKKHNDCENFCPIDVAKGICRLTDEFVFIESQTCGKFEQIPECKLCNNFKNPNQDNIGTCVGLKKEYWTAGETRAALCEGYKN